ncbi:MAG: radical SAM protein [Candidatus Omnitrophota bacterium]
MDTQTIQRVRNGLNDPRIGPETIALMLTRVCNFSCVYCRGGRPATKNNRTRNVADELATEELFELLADAHELQAKEINLGGMDGEPFCRMDIADIMTQIKKRCFTGSLTSNGSFLNVKMAKMMTDCGWDILLLSLDAADASIQQTLRPAHDGKPYFAGIIEFLDFLNRNESGLRILLNVVISKLNYKQLPELVKFADNYKNIESINVLKMLNMGLENYGDLQLNRQELNEFKSILFDLNSNKLKYLGNWLGDGDEKESGLSLRGAEISRLLREEPKRCYANYYILSIDSNGDVIQCPQYQKVIEGLNIRKTPLRELWANEHLQFRRKMADYAYCFDECCTILKEQNKLIYKNITPADIEKGR